MTEKIFERGSIRLSPPRRWAALAVLTLAVLILAVDATVLYLAVPSISRDLAASANQVLWIGDIYSLALAGLLIPMGAWGDRFGRKRLLLAGAVAFGFSSLLAAFAPTAELLVVARLLLGASAASLMPSTLSIIRNVFPDPRERTRAVAVWAAAAAGGAAAGPRGGGVLLEHFWWGSVFLINVPIMVALVGAGTFLLPESKDPEGGAVDVLSVGLSMSAIVPLVYAIKHLVTAGPDAVAAFAALLGGGAGYAFVRRQRGLPNPMIDVGLFRHRAFSGAVLAAFVSVFALAGLLYFFSQYLQLVRGLSPLRAGIAELPIALSAMVVVATVGVAVARLGYGRAVAVGLLLASAGLAAIPVALGTQGLLWLAVALTPLGLGVGLAETITVDAVVSAVPAGKAGAASAVSETAYELGVALGIAVLGSVASALYRSELSIPEGTDGSERAALRDSLASAATALAPDSALLAGARAAFAAAVRTTSLVAAVITLLAAFIAWRTIPSERSR